MHCDYNVLFLSVGGLHVILIFLMIASGWLFAYYGSFPLCSTAANDFLSSFNSNRSNYLSSLWNIDDVIVWSSRLFRPLPTVTLTEFDFQQRGVVFHIVTVDTCLKQYRFDSASALLAMQSAVLARGMLSVRLSVTFRYCVQTNEDTIMRFSASGRTIPLVSGEVTFIRIFAGNHPQRGR